MFASDSYSTCTLLRHLKQHASLRQPCIYLCIPLSHIAYLAELLYICSKLYLMRLDINNRAYFLIVQIAVLVVDGQFNHEADTCYKYPVQFDHYGTSNGLTLMRPSGNC